MIMTDTGREIPLIIGIIGPRMERCQSSCPSPDTVQAVAQLVDSPAHFIQTGVGLLNSLSQFGIRCLIIGFNLIEFFHIHRITIVITISNVVDDLAIGIKAFVVDIRITSDLE